MPSLTSAVIAALLVLSASSAAARDIYIDGSLVVSGNIRKQLSEHVQHERMLLEAHNAEKKANAANAASSAGPAGHFYALGLANPDMARITLDGNVRAAYANAAGSFSLPVPVPASGVAVHQLQVDWGVLLYPTVTVEVDASGNYRCSFDSGDVVASKGKIGVKSSKQKKQEVAAAAAAARSRSAPEVGAEEEEETVGDFDDSEDHHVDAPAAGQQPRLVLQAGAVANFYVPRQHFSIFDLFKNPMVLMIGFTAFVALVMPKLVDQDELRNQMREMQQQTSTSASEGASASAAPAAVTGSAAGGGQQQRRR